MSLHVALCVWHRLQRPRSRQSMCPPEAVCSGKHVPELRGFVHQVKTMMS